MRWTKTVLLFQAVVTLILGMAFFSQVLTLDAAKISELRIQIQNPDSSDESSPEYIDIKKRYASAAYILLFISLMELVIITKLLT
jgi:hypothetical protein